MELAVRRGLFLVSAVVAGLAARALGVPLPWMIGPMLLTAAVGLSGWSPPVHAHYRPIGQIIVSTALGLYFNNEAVAEIVLHGWLMLAAALLTIAAGFIAAIVLVRLGGADGTTAFFASLPGGPVEMSVLAEHFGVPGGPVALAQTLRIAKIVLLVAPVLLLSQHADRIVFRPDGEVQIGGLVLLYALTIAAALLLKYKQIPNAFFMGPIAIAAIVTVSGFTLSGVPAPLLFAGQVLLGTSLGSRFDRNKLAGSGRFVMAAFASTAVLLVLCMGVALGLSIVSDTHLPALIVATAPGSVTEMALTARAVHESVAMVIAYHLIRIFIIIPAATPLYRLFRGLTGSYVRFPSVAGQGVAKPAAPLSSKGNPAE